MKLVNSFDSQQYRYIGATCIRAVPTNGQKERSVYRLQLEMRAYYRRRPIRNTLSMSLPQSQAKSNSSKYSCQGLYLCCVVIWTRHQKEKLAALHPCLISWRSMSDERRYCRTRNEKCTETGKHISIANRVETSKSCCPRQCCCIYKLLYLAKLRWDRSWRRHIETIFCTRGGEAQSSALFVYKIQLLEMPKIR